MCYRKLLLLAGFALLASSFAVAECWDFIDITTDTIIDYPVDFIPATQQIDECSVQVLGGIFSPTLTLLDNGIILCDLLVFGNCAADIQGGQINNGIQALEWSNVMISGGTHGGAEAYGESTMTITGGYLNYLGLGDMATLSVANATVEWDLDINNHNGTSDVIIDNTLFGDNINIANSSTVLSVTNSQIQGGLYINTDSDNSSVLLDNCAVYSITANSGTITLDDGEITQSMLLNNEAKFIMDAGTIQCELTASDDCDVTINSGTINNDVHIDDWTKFAMNNGIITYELTATSNETVSINNGVIGWVVLNTAADFVMNRGVISYDVTAYDSTMKFNDGKVGWWIELDGSSELRMKGGVLYGNLNIQNTSTATIEGGMIGGNLYMGSPTVPATGELVLSGQDFALDGVPLEYGNYYSGYSPLDFGGHLTGTYADGNPLDNMLYIYGDVRLVLVPPALPPTPCDNPPRHDVNGDCFVDLIDFASFVSEWLICGRSDGLCN